MMHLKHWTTTFLLIFFFSKMMAQQQYELNSGWLCHNIAGVKEEGTKISLPAYPVKTWLPATVPGTVLTTLLNNKLIPDPFYGMNNNKIPDIYDAGRDYYTYWFVKDFKETVSGEDEQVWLHFRGVNYSCDVYLNGHKLNKQRHIGMFLRQTYNITSLLSKDGNNRIAVIVYPPNHVGNPNGGQGGDGTIAKDLTHQYVAGWDWIQPIRDRNTGIWDKVTIEKSLEINLKNPHIITLVPGKRYPDKPQNPALIKTSVEIENPTNSIVNGTLQFELNDDKIKKDISLQPKSTVEIQLPDYTLINPKLWWPNGYGPQALYSAKYQFINSNNKILDEETVNFGVREIQTNWNEHTQSMQVSVNGQKIFVKGGNWIVSDAMLRLSPERYDAEIRFHRDMNLNLIRIWGGALLERPEFYDACDRYGLLVFQDFWTSGDCNGRWLDPMKKDDQWTRRNYPDDHTLFLTSVADQVKMIRNHPSLAIWCGGNEITPPEDIFKAMQDSILPAFDGTRYFIPYSNSHEMSFNSIGGNGDGPYTIQPLSTFWDKQTFPFNSEIGSVGTGDAESLERFIPEKNLTVPDYINKRIDSVWVYHKDLGYGNTINHYGTATNIEDFGIKAQLVNYNQYRALIEGFSAHMWDWYTGVIIWKTQNPWTALRGQMYDYYLDPNACLYALHNASESLHVMYNQTDGMVSVVNNTFSTQRNLMLQINAIDIKGAVSLITQLYTEVGPGMTQKCLSIKENTEKQQKTEGLFILARLLNQRKQIVSENLYWLPDSTGNYSGLQHMPKTKPIVKARKIEDKKIEVTINNPASAPLAFFNRISLVDAITQKRVLPTFYSNNYISVLPGEAKTITMECPTIRNDTRYQISIQGWNVDKQFINIE